MMTIDSLKAETALPVIIADHEGTIVYINHIFENTWGWKQQELVGQTLTTIIPENLKDAHQLGFSRFLLTEKPTILNQVIELDIVQADGKKVLAEHFIIAEKIVNKWIFGATIRPVDNHDGNSR